MQRTFPSTVRFLPSIRVSDTAKGRGHGGKAVRARLIQAGRAPTARAKADEVRRLAKEGGLTREGIAKELGIGVASVYRALAPSRF